MDDKIKTAEQEQEQVTPTPRLVARQIGSFAGCNCHYTKAPVWTGYDPAFDPDSHGPYARAPAHVREAETENPGGVRKQVTEVTGGEKQAESLERQGLQGNWKR